MPRPHACRKISYQPPVLYFKPQGVPLTNLVCVEITREQMEAYRLRYDVLLHQQASADTMQTSQSTYQRILFEACQKIADALVHGKAIKIIA